MTWSRRRILPALLVSPALLGCSGGAGRSPRARSDFLVLGRDAEGVGERLDALADAHWDYMDRFAGRLVARGPTLSPDGEEHTGSVHILTAGDAAAARRFADEEPYRRAGLYAEVTVERFLDLLGRTMWERPPAPDLRESSFVVARWPAIATDAGAARSVLRARPDVWAFFGLLVSDDASRCVGLAAAADLPAAEAERAVREIIAGLGAAGATVGVQRWQRGGRR
jgi:uncharacterized protein